MPIVSRTRGNVVGVRILVAALFAGCVTGWFNPILAHEDQPITHEKDVQRSRPLEKDVLQLFVGAWRVLERHFDEKGREIATAKAVEEITSIVDDEGIQRTYTRKSESQVYRALGMLSWSETQKRYVGLWINNDPRSGPSRVTGEWHPEDKTMVFDVDTHLPDGTVQRLKVVERLLDEERRESTTFELKDGVVIKRMQAQFRRATPCPDRLRVIYDDAMSGVANR